MTHTARAFREIFATQAFAEPSLASVTQVQQAAGMAYTRAVLKLYRDIRVAHRNLPSTHRKLGDGYVQQEFRQHRTAAPSFMAQFERQWRDYLQMLRGQAARGDVLGRSLSDQEIADLNEEQRSSLAQALDEKAAGDEGQLLK